MKTHLLPVIIGLSLLLGFIARPTNAQDTKTSKVKIVITEDGKVTSDTTFVLKEGQDPETIKKVVAHLADEEQEMFFTEEDHGKMIIEDEDSEEVIHIKEGQHGKMMLISENDTGDGEKNVTVELTGDDCGSKEKKIEIIIDGENLEWIEKGEGGNADTYIIEKEEKGKKGEKIKVYVTEGGDYEVVVKKEIRVEIEKNDSGKSGDKKEKSEKKKKK